MWILEVYLLHQFCYDSHTCSHTRAYTQPELTYNSFPYDYTYPLSFLSLASVLFPPNIFFSKSIAQMIIQLLFEMEWILGLNANIVEENSKFLAVEGIATFLLGAQNIYISFYIIRRCCDEISRAVDICLLCVFVCVDTTNISVFKGSVLEHTRLSIQIHTNRSNVVENSRFCVASIDIR